MSAPVAALPGVSVINRNAQHPYAAALFADWLLSDENQAFLSAQLRGPVTLKHPFLSAAAQVVPLADPPPEVMARLVGYWRSTMEPKK